MYDDKINCILYFYFIVFLFHWYIVSSFCAVYENTQISFIKDCILSFLLGILIPFVLYLIPSLLRKYALKASQKTVSIYIYKLSNIIPFF